MKSNDKDMNSNDEFSTDDPIKPVEVFIGDYLQANLIKSLLESNGLQTFIENGHMGSIAPWYVTPGGLDAVKVIVSSLDALEANQIVHDFNSHDQAFTDLPDEF